MRGALAVTLLVAAVACGSPTTSPPPSTTSPPPADSGDSGGGSGGGESTPEGGGETPGGGGSAPEGGGDTPDGGGSTPEGGGDGSGGPGEGTEPPSSGDRSVTVTRLDASAECDGLLPSRVPPAISARVAAAGSAGGCGAGLSEGGGHVAVVTMVTPRGFTLWQALSPGGEPESAFSVASPLVPLADGWQGASGAPHGPTSVDVITFAADGSERRTVTPAPSGMGTTSWALVADPAGGSLLVAATDVLPPASCTAHAFRIGAGGDVTAASEVACEPTAAGVSRLGPALVVSGGARLQWLRPDGTPAAPPTEDPAGGLSGPLAPLLDGALAARDAAGRWTRAVRPLAPASEPAPQWLASRPGWSFRFTRGNRGYALFPPAGQQLADCSPGLEIRAPSGTLCGTITFREDGGACASSALDQGWDGTVVQQSARDPCAYRWWPRLLGGDQG